MQRSLRSPGAMAAGPLVVRWPLYVVPLPLLPLAVLLLAALLPAQHLSIPVVGSTPVTSGPFHLDGGWIGSPLIELDADLPPDTTVTFRVELLDPAGRVVLDLSKEGWRETGSWREGGESGTYDERDASVPLSLRPQVSGPHRLRISLEELLDRSGTPLGAPLRFRATVRNHSVDGPLLLFTAAVSGLMLRLLWIAVYDDCRARVVRVVDDSVVAVRLWAGGKGLLRLNLLARYEGSSGDGRRTPLQALPLQLLVSDGMGRPRLRWSAEVPLRRHRSEGEVWWTVRQQLHLQLPEPDSYRIRAVLPERPDGGGIAVEWLRLMVADGTVQPWPVDALTLRPPGALSPQPAAA